MPERHIVEYMANVLQAAVEDWGIANACVHDNASNKSNFHVLNKFRFKEGRSIKILI